MKYLRLEILFDFAWPRERERLFKEDIDNEVLAPTLEIWADAAFLLLDSLFFPIYSNKIFYLIDSKRKKIK